MAYAIMKQLRTIYLICVVTVIVKMLLFLKHHTYKHITT